MIIIPKWETLTKGLNSDFVNIEKLVGYYQGIDGAHGIYFKSALHEGILYYDHFDFLSGGLQSIKGGDLTSTEVVDRLIQASTESSFDITVFRINSDDIYFWSSLFDTRPLYKDLKSDFTDLAGLIKKMKVEGLSGYIETFFDETLGGAVFFRNGQVIHSACFIEEKWPAGLPARNRELAALLYFAQKKSGVFNVKEISAHRKTAEHEKKSFMFNAHATTRMLETLLKSLQTVLTENQKQKGNFSILLKKKFIEKSEKYRFLDPFAAEFQYTGGKVVYDGDADWKRVAGAIIESARELATENHQIVRFDDEIEVWKVQYAKELTELGYDV